MEPEDLLAELRAAGADDDALAEVLDACWDWRGVIPGPAGHLAEALDGGAWRFALQGLREAHRRIAAWWRDPQRREDARVRRAERKARRRERRG